MQSRVVYSVVAAALIILAALYHPLYIALPGSFVEGWSSGSPALALVLEVAAALLAVGAGALTARWSGAASRGRRALSGALAGGIAGLAAFAGLGAAAAGTLGLREILLHGPTTASGDAELVGLLIPALLNIVRYTYLGLWGSLLGGAVLGALGGVLIPASAVESPAQDTLAQRVLDQNFGSAAVMVMTLTLVVGVAVFALLPESIAKSAADVDMALPKASVSVFNWPVGTAFAGLALLLGWMLWTSRTASRVADPGISLARHCQQAGVTASFSGALGIAAVVVAAIILFPEQAVPDKVTIANPVFIAGGCVALSLSGLLLREGQSLTQQARAANPGQPIMPGWLAALLFIGPAIAYALLAASRRWLDKLTGPLALLLGAAYLVLLVYLVRRFRPAPAIASEQFRHTEREFGAMRQVSLPFALSTGGALAFPLLAVLPVALNVVIGLIPTIAVLAAFDRDPGQPPAPAWVAADLVANIHRVQALAHGGIFVLGAITSLLMLLIMSGVFSLRRRALDKAKSQAAPDA